jgi:hypothetical protein
LTGVIWKVPFVSDGTGIAEPCANKAGAVWDRRHSSDDLLPDRRLFRRRGSCWLGYPDARFDVKSTTR